MYEMDFKEFKNIQARLVGSCRKNRNPAQGGVSREPFGTL